MKTLTKDIWSQVFRLAVESSPNALVIVDEQGKIVLMNSQTEKLFGYSREELLNRSVDVLLPATATAGHRAFFSQHQALAMGVGREMLGRRRDGSLVPVEFGLTPIRTENSSWALCLIVDITERKRIEQSLRESEERFRGMADTAPVMLWIAGPDEQWTFFNKGWLAFTGRTMEQELGTGWQRGIHPADRDRVTAHCAEAFQTRRAFQLEFRLHRADGEFRRVLNTGTPRFDLNESFAGYIGSCMDITDMRRTQEEELARQKLESIGVLAGGIAHDFNNLLGSIIADAEVALNEIASGSPCEEEIERIRTVAIRASEIVRELMIYAGQDKAHLEPVDVSRLVEEMLQLLKVSITKRATLKTDLASNLPAVRADAAQLRQVVMNLILNASEAIGELEGTIEVRTSRVNPHGNGHLGKGAKPPAGEFVRLEVCDTGRGMTEEVLGRIFDPFFTTKLSGRGLGLGVVQAIVNRMGGSTHVTSKLGKGSQFEILFPTAAEMAPGTVHPIAPVVSSASSDATATVLLVEDEEGLRLAVAKMLRKKGFIVLEACDGSVAIETLHAEKDAIDVVVLDMTLPGASSRELIAEISRLRSPVKVILTTAYSREMAAPLDHQLVKGFIRKPYQLSDLIRLIRDVVGESADAAAVASGSSDRGRTLSTDPEALAPLSQGPPE